MRKILVAGAAMMAAAASTIGLAAVEALEGDHPAKAPKAKEAGHGVRLAAARLKEHRKAQAERLKDAPGPTFTRQQNRAEARRLGKMPLGMSQRKWHEYCFFPAIRPRGRRA